MDPAFFSLPRAHVRDVVNSPRSKAFKELSSLSANIRADTHTPAPQAVQPGRWPDHQTIGSGEARVAPCLSFFLVGQSPPGL